MNGSRSFHMRTDPEKLVKISPVDSKITKRKLEELKKKH